MFYLLLTLVMSVAFLSLVTISSFGFFHSNLSLFSHSTLISLLVSYSLSNVIPSTTYLSPIMTISLLSILTLILSLKIVYPLFTLIFSSLSLPSLLTNHLFPSLVPQYSFRVILTFSYSTSTPLSISKSFYLVVISLMNTLPLF